MDFLDSHKKNRRARVSGRKSRDLEKAARLNSVILIHYKHERLHSYVGKASFDNEVRYIMTSTLIFERKRMLESLIGGRRATEIDEGN